MNIDAALLAIAVAIFIEGLLILISSFYGIDTNKLQF